MSALWSMGEMGPRTRLSALCHTSGGQGVWRGAD